MKVGNDIKRDNKGMYAMDIFEQMDNSSRTYAEVVKNKEQVLKEMQCVP